MAQLMPLPLTVSCFSKIQVGFTFLVLAHPGSPGQRVCVCVCVRVCWCPQHPTTQLVSSVLAAWPLREHPVYLMDADSVPAGH